MKKYETPELFVDEFAADTMIASNPKNGNGDNNQNCWGCDQNAGDVNGENACFYTPGSGTYQAMCM